MTNRSRLGSWLTVVVAAATLLLAACSATPDAGLLPDADIGTSIVHGQPDTGAHPYVGLILTQAPPPIGGFFVCSGTLLTPTVFLTAAHCIAGFDPATPSLVTFKEEGPYNFANDFVLAAARYPHPMWDDYSQFPDTYDIGVVILSEPVEGVGFGELPPAGYFDDTSQKELKRARFTPVGYGLQDSAPIQANRPMEPWDLARYKATQSFITVNSANTGTQTVMLTNNPGFGNGSGGTCSGDSGGPILLEGTNIVTAVNSFGIAPYCVGNDYAFRTDTSVARDFLQGFLDPGEPPTIDITSPTPGANFSRRVSNIFFMADVLDPEDGDVTVSWTSNRSGLLGTGNPLTYNTASMAYGAHTITARATDMQGNSATDTVSLTIVNDPPTVDIFAPPPGTFCTGEAITFRATVIDVNEIGATLPDARVGWRVDGGSTFATGKTVVQSFGSAGNVRVVVLAIDDQGATDEDWVDLGIEDCTNQPPVASITTPSSDIERNYDGFDGGRGQWYADVVLVGSAIDPEDGALTGGDLVWTTDYAGQLPILGTGTSLTARLYSTTCTGVTHTIKLTATDSDGNVRTALVRIRIWTLC